MARDTDGPLTAIAAFTALMAVPALTAFILGRLLLEAGCFLTGTDESKQKA
jgi:hypothetical protein